MGKIFVHLARKRWKPALRPLVIEPEDPERHRARLAAERREAERIEAERLARMAERRTQRLTSEARRLAHEAELDAIEETAISLFPWDVLWSRRAAVTGHPQATFTPPGKRPYTRLALLWAGYVIRGRCLLIGAYSPPAEFLTSFKACCPVNTDPQQIELLIEFMARHLTAVPDFDVDGFRELARTSAAQWLEYRKAALRELESIEDFGGGWIAASFDDNPLLFFGADP